MNAALGENLPVPPALLASLRNARERSDAKLAELLALYRAPLGPHGAKEFSNIQRIRQAWRSRARTPTSPSTRRERQVWPERVVRGRRHGGCGA